MNISKAKHVVSTAILLLIFSNSSLGQKLEPKERITEPDHTTSMDTASDRNMEKQRNLPEGTFKSGGADEFLKSLKTEIIPFVDKHYKTNTDRGITGHSYGGLFAAWCLINSDGYFTRFGISSPSLWWDNGKLLNQAVLQFTNNKTWDIPPSKVFICVGENEGFMLPLMEKFTSYLETADYENIDLSWQIFNGETHLSVWPASTSKTITTLYGKK